MKLAKHEAVKVILLMSKQRQIRRNYLRKIDPAKLKRGELTHLIIRHDDWCPFLRGGDCTCNPDVEYVPHADCLRMAKARGN